MADGGTVYNHDIAGLVRRIDRFRRELSHSVSSGVSGVREHDRARYASYINALNVYHDWMVAQPQLDLPESHPTGITVEPSPAMPGSENESVSDLVYLLDILRKELCNSQSARLPQGLNKFDSSRFLALTEKMNKFLVDYVDKVTPLDLPESSPQSAMTPPGRQGT